MLVISSASLADKHNIESALAYAAMGWQVFPAPPDSKKSYKSEQRSGAKWGMTGDPVEIRADFTRWPKAALIFRPAQLTASLSLNMTPSRVMALTV